MKMSSSKAFVLAIEIFQDDPKKCENFLSDKRLSNLEKKIISSLIHFRKNNYQQALTLLNGLIYPDSFSQGVAHLIQGMIYNNLTDLKRALEFYENSIKSLENYNHSKILFTAYYNKFIAAYNLNLKNQMLECLNYFKSHKVINQRQDVAIVFCEFCYFLKTDQVKEAEEKLFDLENKRSHMNSALELAFFTNKFTFFIKLDLYDKAKVVLKQMQSFKRFKVTSNYRFMDLVLKFILTDNPIYVFENEFKETPFLFYQINVLKNLQESNSTDALRFWNLLQEVSPTLYKDKFCYAGDKCLFSVALKKLIQNKQTTLKSLAGMDRLAKAFYILKNSPSGISNSELFKLIYDRNPESKSDFLLLSKLLHKLKQKRDCQIEFKKKVYKLKVA